MEFIPAVEHCIGSLPSLGSLRNLEGATRVFAQSIYMCFMDLKKAFDHVPQGKLKEGCSVSGLVTTGHAVLVQMVEELYSHSQQ